MYIMVKFKESEPTRIPWNIWLFSFVLWNDETILDEDFYAY